MKKFFLLIAIAATATVCFAATMKVQFVITECGTEHQIPDNSTIDEACDWLEHYSNTEC